MFCRRGQHCRSVLWRVGVSICLLIACRAPSQTKDARTWRWRLYDGTRSTSPCSKCCVTVVLSTAAPLSVCGEHHIVLAAAWAVWGFRWYFFDQNTIECNSVPVVEPVFSNKRWLTGIPSNYLEISLGSSSYNLPYFFICMMQMNFLRITYKVLEEGSFLETISLPVYTPLEGKYASPSSRNHWLL